ncbi:SurA N-terminal domain-containing protein [Sphingomonas crocodyli]|uniref:peptidylprolyl isomerase n=1 Tax=Sphingomonas crocodyli TaxID=1979270 RepID=A0A437LXS3_9SPHN|nr:SurA N-terminal domain-containing protein [Sphingomonas crocodyli]RVT90162.1 hypothetical protein EOD43_17810 [Sphingomonas crocodyli]
MWRYAVVAVASLSLAGCEDKPDGQVIATVNGEEITRPELNAILSTVTPDEKQDAKTLQNLVLDDMIQKRLLAQAAKEEGLDRSQDYLLRSRAANQALLIDAYGKKLLSGVSKPYDADVEAYMRANPWRFSQRIVYRMDQIRIGLGDFRPELVDGAARLDDVASRLESQGIAFQRGGITADSATFTKSDFDKINALQPGEVFKVPQAGMMLVSAVVQRQPSPLEGEKALQVARNLLQTEAGRDTLKNRVAALKKSANIEYQPGFAAPKTSR